MTKKTDNTQKVLDAYRAACQDLADAVNAQLFEGHRKPYWIGDIVGGECDFDDCDILSTEEMALILSKGVMYDQYAEWRDANIDEGQFVNLQSWLMGCRHHMIKPTKE